MFGVLVYSYTILVIGMYSQQNSVFFYSNRNVQQASSALANQPECSALNNRVLRLLNDFLHDCFLSNFFFLIQFPHFYKI